MASGSDIGQVQLLPNRVYIPLITKFHFEGTFLWPAVQILAKYNY